jgi:hypothetical protein
VGGAECEGEASWVATVMWMAQELHESKQSYCYYK